MSCTLQDAGEFVQVEIGPAPSRTILDCYEELLALCARHHINRALLVSLDTDATTHAALAEAIEAMASDGLPPDLKLAMVAQSPPIFDVYSNAQELAARHGIAARAFRSRQEAVQWLTGRPAGERAVPRG